MRKKLYCEKCDKMVDYEIVEKKEIFKVRGEDIEITARIAVCKECGNELSEPSLEDENLKKAFRIYAERHSLILSEEIKAIREKYGLSQDVFAKILGIGKVTLARYEAGALPSESLSNLIKSAENSKFFMKLLEDRKNEIALTDYKRIKERLKKQINEIAEYEEAYQTLNGGRIDFPKLYGTVAFMMTVSAEMGYKFLTKVRFMKLLWLVDKVHYEEYYKPLTGLVYAHLPMGPAPHWHDSLLELLEAAGVVKVKEELIDDDKEIIKILSNDETFERYLDDKEKGIIERVVRKFIAMPTSKLIELTHEDKRWQDTYTGELIRFVPGDVSKNRGKSDKNMR